MGQPELKSESLSPKERQEALLTGLYINWVMGVKGLVKRGGVDSWRDVNRR